MLNANDTRTCDAEIGRIGTWHRCDRKAVIESIRSCHPSSSYSLDFCETHKDLATTVEPYILVKEVRQLQPVTRLSMELYSSSIAASLL